MSYPRASLSYVQFAIAMVIAVALVMFTSACTGAQRTAFNSSFKSCAVADVGQLVAPGKTLIDDVASKVKGNSPTLEADLATLVTMTSIDAVECAILAVTSTLLAPADTGAGSGSGEGKVMAAAPAPGALRARAWLKARSAE